MSRAGLIDAVFKLPDFKSRLQALILASVREEFPGIIIVAQPDFSTLLDWKYLITSASLLAQSDQSEHQDAALRIAQAAVQLASDENTKLGGAAIFELLANNPALSLSLRRRLLPEEYLDRFPAPIRLDVCRRRLETSVLTQRGTVSFSRFQANVYRGAAEHDWISVSAPTSAGKSYVLNRIIGEHLDQVARSHIAYIVPTRALIQQVIQDLTELNRAQGRENVIITALPKLPAGHERAACLFVVTQERMHWLLNLAGQGLRLDLLVLDEAQKIGDGSRGILMQQVLEQAARLFPKLKVLFSSPLTTNPELLVEDVPRGSSTHYISSEQPTVNQNLIWAEQKRGRISEWKASLWLGEVPEQLGDFVLPAPPDPISKRLPFVAFAMTESANEGGCLVYVNIQADAEKAAVQLSELRRVNLSSDSEIDELIKLIRKIIHNDYLLAKTLPKGVAFHYGNMPLIIRTETERLFKAGKIRYLVCTSTLIEGVNLPAKYIFVRAPKKGRKDVLLPADFWNLAGRAGRLGTEFQGSVVCVDPNPKIWKTDPPRKRQNTPMKRALDDVISDHDGFLAFLSKETVAERPQRKSHYEHTLGYCSQLIARGESFAEHAWVKRFKPDLLRLIETHVRKTLEGIQVGQDTLSRNAGVSPVAMQRLLEYFRGHKEDPSHLVPFAPADPDAVAESYVQIVTRISKYLSGDHVALAYPRAILVVNWMCGHPLRRIIADNISYWAKNGDDDVPRIIRDTMEEVEQFARFTFVKFISCYLDILRQHLTEINRHDLLGRIHDLQLYAEFGASQKTQMSLMDLGLSRVAAIELSEYIVDVNLERHGCLDWINSHDLKSLGLSLIVLREVNSLRKIADKDHPATE